MILPEVLLCRAAEALRAQARDKAGHSQAPEAFEPEDTQEWADALHISRYLAYLRSQRKGARNAANAQRDA